MLGKDEQNQVPEGTDPVVLGDLKTNYNIMWQRMGGQKRKQLSSSRLSQKSACKIKPRAGLHIRWESAWLFSTSAPSPTCSLSRINE